MIEQLRRWTWHPRGVPLHLRNVVAPLTGQALAIRQQFFIDLKHAQTYRDGSNIAQRLDNEFVCVRVSNDATKEVWMSVKPTDTLAELASQADWYERNITNKYCIDYVIS